MHKHYSVMLQETIDGIAPMAEGRYIDGTLGWGGHTLALLQASAPTGHVLAFDRDISAIEEARRRLGEREHGGNSSSSQDLLGRLTIAHASFADMGVIAPQHGFEQVDGIVLDLGLSSMQLDSRSRGFSFRYDAPLDMRFDQSQGDTAATLLKKLSESEISDVLWRYGEVKRSRAIAREIRAQGPIETTTQLADLIVGLTPARERRKRKTHPATQTFQALRIAVNDELGALERVLPAAINLLKPGGRLAVISFHSLEDRFVKRFIRDAARECVCPPRQPICTCETVPTLRPIRRKAIQPSEQEVAANPRSRSARLRVAERLAS